MRTASNRRPGRQPMTEKRELYVQLMHQGMSNSAACRQLGIDRKTGHWWKNGGVVIRNGGDTRGGTDHGAGGHAAEGVDSLPERGRAGDDRGRCARWPDVDVDRRGARAGGVDRREGAEAQRRGRWRQVSTSCGAHQNARPPAASEGARLEVDIDLRGVVQGSTSISAGGPSRRRTPPRRSWCRHRD